MYLTIDSDHQRKVRHLENTRAAITYVATNGDVTSLPNCQITDVDERRMWFSDLNTGINHDADYSKVMYITQH